MSDRAPALMRKAMQSLQPAERDELLDAVLLGQLSLARMRSGRLRPSGVTRPVPLIPDGDPIPARDMFGSLKVLPVRLPKTDYERLRTFCQEHQFSMAVVIRTLLERFLDDHAGDEGEA